MPVAKRSKSMSSRPRKRPDSIDTLATQLHAAIARANLGKYQLRFYTGGMVTVDTDARPTRRPKPLAKRAG